MRIISLLQVKEDSTNLINKLGFINQMFFDRLQDAFYYLMLSHDICTLTVEKRSDSFFKIKIVYDYDNKTEYYHLQITNTLSYDWNNKFRISSFNRK